MTTLLNDQRIASPSHLKRDAHMREVPDSYSPIRHLCTSIGACLTISIAAFVAAASQGVSIWSWATIGTSILLVNVLEWAIHKYALHHPFGAKLYRLHAGRHHGAFSDVTMAVRGHREWSLVLVDLPNFSAAIALALLLAGGVAAVLSLHVGLLMLGTFIAHLAEYELWHLAYHMPEDHWSSRVPGMKAQRRHHALHHETPTVNFNVTLAMTDFAFRTLVRDSPLKKQMAAVPQTEPL